MDFKVISGVHAGGSARFDGSDPVFMGTSKENDLFLLDDDIFPRHAKFRLGDDGISLEITPIEGSVEVVGEGCVDVGYLVDVDLPVHIRVGQAEFHVSIADVPQKAASAGFQRFLSALPKPVRIPLALSPAGRRAVSVASVICVVLTVLSGVSVLLSNERGASAAVTRNNVVAPSPIAAPGNVAPVIEDTVAISAPRGPVFGPDPRATRTLGVAPDFPAMRKFGSSGEELTDLARSMLQSRLGAVGLGSVKVDVMDTNLLRVSGVVDQDRRASWQDTQKWFDSVVHGSVKLLSEISVADNAASVTPPQIEAVWLHGSEPFVTVAGRRYKMESVLPNGWKLVGLSRSGAQFEFNQNLITLEF